MDKRIYITFAHGLKSEFSGDLSRNIKETTHQIIRFTDYVDDENTWKGWDSYEVVISNEELFALLKDRARHTHQDKIPR